MANDLLTSLASCATCEEQIDALETYVSSRFDVTRNEQNIRAKIDLYWSIAHAILTETKESISQASKTLMAQSSRWLQLASAPPGPWHEKIAADVGPRLRKKVASLDAQTRMEHDMRLWVVAKAMVAHVLWQLAKFDFPEMREAYQVSIDAAYPFRDIDGKPVFLSLDVEADLGDAFIRGVSPFLDQTLSPTKRAELYHANLYAARIDEKNILSPWEKPLVGQMGVFARRPISNGACVGVYGGILLENQDRIILRNPSYIAKCPGDNKLYVNGENIVSLMNTSFTYDNHGTITGQDAARVNLRARAVPCNTRDGKSISLIALFADREIDEDDELRWIYGYGEEELSNLAKYLT